MKTLLALAVTATITLITNPATSQEICYLEKSDGNRINLEGICGGRVAQANPDAAFIAEYRRLAATQTQATMVLATFNEDPQNYINGAKNICRGLRSGKTEQELMRIWNRPWVNASPQVGRAGLESGAILFTLAPKYYCPEFSNLN